MTNGLLLRFLTIVLLLALSYPLLSQEEEFKEFYISFKSGKYQEAITKINKLKTNGKSKAMKNYLKGICYNKMGEFEQAAKFLKKAIKLKSDSKDIFYEYGQALYAMNELNTARKSFKRSYKEKFKPAVSLYYMGHISQILEEFKKAKKYYNQIGKVKTAEKEIKQVAQFQLGEVLLALAETKDDIREMVRKYVLPRFKIAEEVDKYSEVAKDIRKRYNEVELQYGLNPDVLRNGKKLKPQKYTLYIDQKVKYDSNITLTTDTPTTTATKEDSYIFDTTVYGKYRFAFQQRFLVHPVLKLNHIIHSNRDIDTVFKNDAYTIAPALKTSWHHKIAGKEASLLLDIDYNYTERDRESKHDKIFYSRYTTYSLGYKAKFFEVGNTTFKLKQKYYYAYDRPLDSITFTMFLNQVMLLPNKHILIATAVSNSASVVNDEDSTDSYLLRADYIIPKIDNRYTLHLSYSLTILDTLQQSETRGTEKTYTPGIKFIKKTSKNSKVSVAYNYTKKTSLSEDNAYTKHVTTLAFKYNF